MRTQLRTPALQSVRVLSGIMGATAFVSISACDIPTSAPILEQRWIVPGETSRITVASLLPSGVSVLPDSSGFTLSSGMATIARPLSDDCAVCVQSHGSLSAKPALTVNASLSSSLAADVSAATLTGGTLMLNLTNNYNFDPLRPNGNVAPFGTATITVSNGGVALGTMVLNGASQSLAANGGKLALNIPLSGGVSGSTPVSVTVSMISPEGTEVTMDASRTLNANATPLNLKVSSAQVSVAGRTLTSSSDVDFSDISETISDRTSKGSLLLDIQNPFNVTSNLRVTLTADGGDAIVKSVALATGNTTRAIDFTKDELKLLFGHNVQVSITGPAQSNSGTVTVSPTQAVVVKTRFDLSLSVGGSSNE